MTHTPARPELMRSTLRLSRGVAVAMMSYLTLAMAAPACAKKASDDASPAQSISSAPAPSASSTAIPSGTRPASSAATAPMGSNAPSIDPMATLFGRMSDELKTRPNVHPSVDDGFAAFAKAGVAIVKPAQSLATTYKAAFCSHGVTQANDVAVLLCEYPDAAQEQAGLDEAKKIFPGMSTRHTFGRKTLLMAVTFQDHPPKASATAAEQKVVAAFNAL